MGHEGDIGMSAKWLYRWRLAWWALRGDERLEHEVISRYRLSLNMKINGDMRELLRSNLYPAARFYRVYVLPCGSAVLPGPPDGRPYLWQLELGPGWTVRIERNGS